MNYWNNLYIKNKHISVWPWSDVVSLLNKFIKNKLSKKSSNVLELGCGAGANIPFFYNHKCKYYGIDNSSFIISKLKKKIKNKNIYLTKGNFVNYKFSGIKFDLIFDRAAITHNNEMDIKKTMNIVYQNLKKNSLFIGVDWYSDKCSFLKNKKKNYMFFNKGPFSNIGGVYFSNKKNIKSFFKKFQILHLQEKVITTYNNNKKIKFSSWNIVAKKN